MLEVSYVVHRLPPFHRTFGKRLVKTPRLHFVDAGLAAWLLGIEDASQLVMRQGRFHDCEPLQMNRLEGMLAAAGFGYRRPCIEAWRATFESERPGSCSARVLRATPDAVLTPLTRIIPTLICHIECAPA